MEKKNNQTNGTRILVPMSYESHAALMLAAERMTGGNVAELLRRAASAYTGIPVRVGGHKNGRGRRVVTGEQS